MHDEMYFFKTNKKKRLGGITLSTTFLLFVASNTFSSNAAEVSNNQFKKIDFLDRPRQDSK